MRSTAITSALASVAVLLGTVGCDQVTKHIARSSAPHGHTVLGGAVEFTLALNPGGFLSFGQSFPPRVRELVFTTASAVFVAVILVLLWRKRHTPLSVVTLGFALLAAGGLGNLVDRVLQRGLVTDFCVIHAGPLRTGIFNVADAALTLGVLLLLTFKEHRRTATA